MDQPGASESQRPHWQTLSPRKRYHQTAPTRYGYQQRLAANLKAASQHLIQTKETKKPLRKGNANVKAKVYGPQTRAIPGGGFKYPGSMASQHTGQGIPMMCNFKTSYNWNLNSDYSYNIDTNANMDVHPNNSVHAHNEAQPKYIVRLQIQT